MNMNLHITFRQIQRKPYFSHMPVGTICAVMHGIEVPNKYRSAMGLPLLVKVPETNVYNPATHRTVNRNGSQPRNLTRATIYPGTADAKIVDDLYRVTGRRYVCIDERKERAR